MKRLLAASVVLVAPASSASAQNFYSYWKEIAVTDSYFGAKCDNSTDDTKAIQKAFDYATANNIQTIYIPGKCVVTPPLFLDPVGNLRGADGTNGQSYNAGTTYTLGQTVNSGGVAYISLINGNIGNTPASSPSQWQVYVYNPATTYAAGIIVGYQCPTCLTVTPWISLQGSNTGNIPSLSSTFWESWTTTPYNFGFTACVRGGWANPVGGLPGVLSFTSNAAPGIWIGPGAGMCAKNLAVRGPGGGTNGTQNPNGVGIAISGGNGGASKTTIEDVNVSNFYSCFNAAVNQPQAGEDNVFINDVCGNAWIGLASEGESDQNLIINANFQSPIGVRSITALNEIIGGEWGAPLLSNSFSISSISSVTSATCLEHGGVNCYSFSFTVASPDSSWPSKSFTLYNPSTTYSAGAIVTFSPTAQSGDPSLIRLWQSLAGSNTGNQPAIGSSFWIPVAGQGNYSAFTILATGSSSGGCATTLLGFCTGFGLIPLQLTGWNVGTGVATVTTYTPWTAFYFNTIAALSSTDLQTEIQAATTVYAAERQIVMQGQGFHGSDMWMQPGAPICLTLLDDFAANTNAGNKIEFFHYDDPLGWPQYGPSQSPSQHNLSGYYCIHSFPFIRQQWAGGGIDLNGILASPLSPPGDPVIFDVNGTNNYPLTVENSPGGLFSPTVRTVNSASPLSGGSGASNYTSALGSFEWDVDPFMPRNSTARGTMNAYQIGSLKVPFSGFVPAPGATPRATTTQLANWNSPPTLGTYPPMWGNVPYSLMNWNSGTLSTFFAVSAHPFLSYGQSITCTWAYVGGGFIVQVDSTCIGYMVPGLTIGLNNGSGNVNYTVTAVEPGLGYVTVFNQASDAYSASNLLAGTAGTVYTGSSITEPSYSIAQH